jgi:hypothetical protein
MITEAERVSVEFGLTWTNSDTFQVLGRDLPQHLPQRQFSSVNSTEAADRLRRSHSASARLRTPPNRHLPSSDPLTTPLAQVLALGNQTLMNRACQESHTMPADLVLEVLAGDADPGGASRTQDIHIQVVPLLSGHHRANSGHQVQENTPVLVAAAGWGQVGSADA